MVESDDLRQQIASLLETHENVSMTAITEDDAWGEWCQSAAGALARAGLVATSTARTGHELIAAADVIAGRDPNITHDDLDNAWEVIREVAAALPASREEETP